MVDRSGGFDYRMVRHVYDEEFDLAIHEVWYDSDGKISSICADSAVDTRSVVVVKDKDAIGVLTNILVGMKAALAQPIVSPEDFEKYRED